MYGVLGNRGNRVNNAVTGWMISVSYFSLNPAAAATAAFSLVARTGLPVNTAVKAVVVVLIAAITLAISVWGHAAIIRLHVPIALAPTAVFAVVGFVVVRHTDFG